MGTGHRDCWVHREEGVLVHLLQREVGGVNFLTRLKIFYSKTTLCCSRVV